MGRSVESFNKKEREKKKSIKARDKKEKAEERKANSGKKSLEDMMAYIDEFGNISSTPPDPTKRAKVSAEEIQISVPKQEDLPPPDPNRKGVVTFYNTSKGFGFIKDMQSQDSVFVHMNALQEPITENDKVTFEVEQGPKGLNAVRVKKVVK